MERKSDSENPWNALLRVARSWRLEWNVDQLLIRIAREAVEFLDVERGIVLLLGKKGLAARAVWPELQEKEVEQVINYGKTIAQQVVQQGRPVYAHQLDSSKKKEEESDIRVVFCVPLTAAQGMLGALYVDSRESHHGLSQKDREFLEMLGLQAAVALEHALLYQSAITDPLTGLFSHRHFQREIEQALRRADRSKEPVSLILLDLDHFKELNDTLGHEAGNQVLLQVSAGLKDTLRTTDILARFGGDEFEILLPNTTAQDAFCVAEKIREKMERTQFVKELDITATLGVSAFPDNALDAQSLFVRADEALYEAKESGRNQTTLCSKLETEKDSPESNRRETRSRESGFRPAMVPSPINMPMQVVVDLPDSSSEANWGISTGEKIDGHPVLRRISSGGAGDILLVRQPDLGRPVALKRPLTTHLTTEQAEAFEREAKVTASLEHPGVVTVHTMGRDTDGRRYYTMKHLLGRSLAQILEECQSENAEFVRSYPLNRLLEILQRASEAIAYAHQKGVSHLDLTPSNMVVGEFGEVTIIDWGAHASTLSRKGIDKAFSKIKEKETHELPILVGEPGYLAPEQVPKNATNIGPASDVHALGSILYEILTGQTPYARETTRLSVEALLAGDLTPPEMVAPDSGIDPFLSELCLNALSSDPSQRPTALSFSTAIGKFVRNEMEWETILFGPGQHLIQEKEWTSLIGAWNLNDEGSWVSDSDSDSLLVWNLSVPGAFRFAVECWSESGLELSLIGQGASPDFKGKHYNEIVAQGYCFQVGAEFNTCTKLSRQGQDLLAKPGLRVEPGRHYRLEIEIREGWVYCFLDGKKVFSFRELFPFHGTHIGFYAFGKGTHFKPIEIQKEKWGLFVPAMRMADDLYRLGFYEAALERYRDLADRVPHRLEGQEARLKIGSCFTKLKQFPIARKAYQTLVGSQYEPFALAEEALLDFNWAVKEVDRKPLRGIEKILDLRKRFPKSQAKACLLKISAVARLPSFKIDEESKTKDLESKALIQWLGAEAYKQPAMSQIRGLTWYLSTLFQLGEYAKAEERLRAFQAKMAPEQHNIHGFQGQKAVAALANNAPDLLPVFPFDLTHWSNDWIAWDAGVLILCILQKMSARGFLEAYDADPKTMVFVDPQLKHMTLLVAHMATGEPSQIEAYLKNNSHFKDRMKPKVERWLGDQIVGSRSESWYHWWLENLELHKNADTDPHLIETKTLVKARWALEHRKFDEAQALINNQKVPSDNRSRDRFFLYKIFLTSINSGLAACHEKHAEEVRHELTGTPLDLAEMFMGAGEPVPGKKWPHPVWRPEWRLWLALWLEAREQSQEAQEIAMSAIDPRYGMMHCQPGLCALVERTQAKLKQP